MNTHPEILKAIAAADAQVGMLPPKWLVCSWQVYREIKEHYQNKAAEDGVPFFDPPKEQISINVYHDRAGVPINVQERWEGRRWELCERKRRHQIFQQHP